MSEAITILLEFYAAQDTQGSADFLASVASVRTYLTWFMIRFD